MKILRPGLSGRAVLGQAAITPFDLGKTTPTYPPV